MTRPDWKLNGVRAANRGAALAVGLLLLAVLTILAVAGLSTATLELQMAGNQQYQERAFQAAEAGVEQAIAAAIFSTALPANYTPASGTTPPLPIRGSGTQIAGCADQGKDPDEQCEYFIRYDEETGSTPVPGGGYSLGTGFEALHFVVDSYGVDRRDATSEHQHSFYIVGPGGA
jgi:type IV pilus assembly protein PilX